MKNHWEKLEVDGRAILRRILKNEMRQTNLTQDRCQYVNCEIWAFNKQLMLFKSSSLFTDSFTFNITKLINGQFLDIILNY